MALSVASALGLFAAWWLVTAAGWIEPLFLPSPGAVFERLVEVGREGFGGATLWRHAWASLERVFLAFVLAAATAIPVGLAMGVSRVARGLSGATLAHRSATTSRPTRQGCQRT